MTTDADRIRDVTHRLFHALEHHHLPRRPEIEEAREKLRRGLRRIPEDLDNDEKIDRWDRLLKRFEVDVAPFI